MKIILTVLIYAMSSAIFAQTPSVEPGVSQELARWRAARYSDVRYQLNLTLEKMSPVLKGMIEVRVKVSDAGLGGRGDAATKNSPPYEGGVAAALGGRGGSLIVLDWRKIKGYEDRSTISNVSINGKTTSLARDGENHPVGEAPTPLLRKEGSSNDPLTYRETNEHLIFRDGVVAGENVIKLDFTSPILTSGSAITRYVDKEDGSEYIYSLFVPSDASTAFPVFDQPDLKAKFKLIVRYPGEWQVVTNEKEPRGDVLDRTETSIVLRGSKQYPTDPKTSVYTKYFDETKPISTYVFAFAAGPWAKVSVPGAVATGPSAGRAITTPSAEAAATPPKTGGEPDRNPVTTAPGTDKRADPSISIYVRKSQAAKFKPHAAEVFRLNREAVRYFEQYFDYKFPFPKYDLVLIPEFPFGGMEHAGATFLRESSIIFPQEPTKNDHISRATLIFHEAAHQWFGDTVTMRWFDDLWLKEGFATFTAYKAMEKIMPEMNAWKVFYERIKQGAYQTDSTRGTTAIYQPIANLSAAKSAYGNIVYNKAPAFLRQAEFYLGEDKFQTAVRAFLKKHEFGNAGWEDLVAEFEGASVYQKGQLADWASHWVRQRGVPKMLVGSQERYSQIGIKSTGYELRQFRSLETTSFWRQRTKLLIVPHRERKKIHDFMFGGSGVGGSDDYLSKSFLVVQPPQNSPQIKLGRPRSTADFEPYQPGSELLTSKIYPAFIFPNYQDYGYGIFLLDEKSRDYVLKNIQNEKDPFLRTMMWGALWDSVREGELDPRVFVELVVKNLATTTPSAAAAATPPQTGGESDESTIATLLGRTGTALNYYLSEPPALAGGQKLGPGSTNWPVATAPGSELRTRVEDMLIERMRNASTLGQRITYYRAFLNIGSSDKARGIMKEILNLKFAIKDLKLKTKDKFDIVTRLLILNEPDAPRLLAELEKVETSDEAKRYAYAAKAGIATAENKAKYWKDFTESKEISESWIEAAFGPWNSIRHADLTLPYLQKALQELPNHKRNRKIFFVNGWLGAFIGGQRSEEALNIVNKFLADNPKLDDDLRLKILENMDLIERAVKIRANYGKN